MKSLIMAAIAALVLVFPAVADSPPWTCDATYTFTDADPYFVENFIGDTATVNIIGGAFGALHCYDYSTVYMQAGLALGFRANNSSKLYFSGGELTSIYASGLSEVNLSVLTYSFDESGPLNFDGRLSGVWPDSEPFELLVGRDSWSHFTMNEVPEPCSVLILLAAIAFRRPRR